jgi:hypothetical protein
MSYNKGNMISGRGYIPDRAKRGSDPSGVEKQWETTYVEFFHAYPIQKDHESLVGILLLAKDPSIAPPAPSVEEKPRLDRLLRLLPKRSEDRSERKGQ